MPRACFPTSCLRVALAAALLAGGPPAWGQPGGLHPLPHQPRALHARLAEADAAALVRVMEISSGRIVMRAERVLHGALAERFELKRSPLQPPPLAAGELALVFLRGARSPYLLIDEPRDMLHFKTLGEAAPFADAVAALVATREPRALVALHVRWIDEGPEPLRELAEAALLAREPVAPLDEDAALERARVALDRARPEAVRRAAARLTAHAPAAVEQLLRAVPTGPEAVDAAVASIAIEAGVIQRAPALEAALGRALDHPEARLRRRAVRAAGLVAQPGGALAKRVEALVESDPDAAVRRDAQLTRERLKARAR